MNVTTTSPGRNWPSRKKRKTLLPTCSAFSGPELTVTPRAAEAGERELVAVDRAEHEVAADAGRNATSTKVRLPCRSSAETSIGVSVAVPPVVAPRVGEAGGREGQRDRRRGRAGGRGDHDGHAARRWSCPAGPGARSGSSTIVQPALLARPPLGWMKASRPKERGSSVEAGRHARGRQRDRDRVGRVAAGDRRGRGRRRVVERGDVVGPGAGEVRQRDRAGRRAGRSASSGSSPWSRSRSAASARGRRRARASRGRRRRARTRARGR